MAYKVPGGPIVFLYAKVLGIMLLEWQVLSKSVPVCFKLLVGNEDVWRAESEVNLYICVCVCAVPRVCIYMHCVQYIRSCEWQHMHLCWTELCSVCVWLSYVIITLQLCTHAVVARSKCMYQWVWRLCALVSLFIIHYSLLSTSMIAMTTAATYMYMCMQHSAVPEDQYWMDTHFNGVYWWSVYRHDHVVVL